jgi:hypothetical protein
MGRHSAPTEDDEADLVAVAVAPSAAAAGRHARAAEEAEEAEEADDAALEEAQTHQIPLIEAALAAEADRADTEPTQPLPDVDEVPAPEFQPATVDSGPPDSVVATPTTAEITTGGSATAEIAPVDAAVEESPVSPPAVAPARNARIGKGNHSTSADLALLREHSEVRNRCIAAVIVPFVLYTAFLLAISSMDVFLIWIWVPTVSAGILAGGFLDAAHRRYDARVEPPTI